MKKYYKHILLSGILLSLGWPTYGSPLLLFFALVPILHFVNEVPDSSIKNKNLTVFAYSYITFLIWNIWTTWWIYNSSVFGATFAILCNSSFFAILITLYHWSLKHLSKIGAAVFLVSSWISFEKFHLLWDFSWPWLNLGNGFSEYINWIQWYEYTGVFGGSVWVLALNFFFFFQFKKFKKESDFKKIIIKCVPGLIWIAIPIVCSLIILNKIEEPKTFSEVIVIQPNVDPYDEKYELTNEDFKNSLINLTSELITDKTSFVVTPETFFTERSGFDIDIFENSQFNISLKEFIASHKNLNLISGTQFYKLYRSKNEPTETANKIQEGFWADFYNSAILSAPKQKSQIYHKSKLVVGVENMPYKSFFKPLLGEFMLDLGGTVSSRAIQSERTVFSHSINETKVAPIICYESIYGEYVTEYARNGADFFTILTNDAWWGNTQGHKQLLSYARLRAIENRRSIARSANTGISAFINHKGEIIKTLPYEEKGALIGKVGLNKNLTFYSRYGDYIARIANFTFFLLLLSCLASILRRKK